MLHPRLEIESRLYAHMEDEHEHDDEHGYDWGVRDATPEARD
jgi:hypothetical protein